MADGADGDVGMADAKAAGIGQDIESIDDGLEVMEGLAHAHHDEIPDRGFIPRAELLIDKVNLGDDLASGEMTAKTHLTGGTKNAAHGAADLAAETGGVAAGESHEDGFDILPIRELEEEFLSNAVAAGSGADFVKDELFLLGEPSANFWRELDRLLEMEELKDLGGVRGIQPLDFEGFLQGREGEVQDGVHRGQECN